MMLIEQTSVPLSALPVAEFKDHLRLGTGFSDGNIQDEVLETCLRAAISAIEARSGKALIEKQFLLSVTAWRELCSHPIPIAPVSALVLLNILDRAGTPSLVDPGGYSLQKDASVPRLLASGVFPTIPDGGGAELVFLAGFGTDWMALPDDLLRAVYILSADFYENRHTGAFDGGQFPVAVQSLIERYRLMRLGGAV